MKRAKNTAKIIVDVLQIPMLLDRRLRECAHGVFEGMTIDEVAKVYGDEITESWRHEKYDKYDFGPFGGESRDEVLGRHMEIINNLPTICPKEKILLLVGHDRGLNTVLYEFGETPNLQRGEYRIIKA